MTPPKVAICVVTYNDASEIRDFFSSIATVEHTPLELVLVDCHSTDDTVETARSHWPERFPDKRVRLDENLGFAGGMNRAFAETDAPWVLTLNADARPEPDFVSQLLEATSDPSRRIGAITGRLTRFEENHVEPDSDPPAVLDACGMRLVTTWRHLDRGSGEVDRGQFSQRVLVFGGTGAATLFRREALADVAVDGELFALEFHSFREDAELAFRLRERGWEIVYEPSARAYHRRSNLPERRRAMPAYVNYHSLKNRYLLRAYHQTFGNLLRTFLPTLLRDLLAFGYVLACERSSLEAYRWLWTHRHQILARRRKIQRHRTVPATAIDRWFQVDEIAIDPPTASQSGTS